MTTAPVPSITDELLAELDEKAKVATPGPWEVAAQTVYALNDDGFNRFSALVQDARTSVIELYANATHIAAANPSTLLALIAHIRSLEERLEKAEKDAQRYRWLRSRYICGDFAYPKSDGRKVCAAVFEMPEKAWFFADFDKVADFAIAQEGAEHE